MTSSSAERRSAAGDQRVGGLPSDRLEVHGDARFDGARELERGRIVPIVRDV
jgi:hypothetical protein